MDKNDTHLTSSEQPASGGRSQRESDDLIVSHETFRQSMKDLLEVIHNEIATLETKRD